MPPLWHYEVRNALLMAERRGRVTGDAATERLNSLEGLPIATDQDANLRVTFDLAREHRLSFYDALYLELATRREAPLTTLDGRLAMAAAAEGLDVSPS